MNKHDILTPQDPYGILYRYNCKMQNIIHSLFSTLCMYVAEDIVFARNLAAQRNKR